MATVDQLATALRNADAAGDADAARVLAAEIVKMRGAAPPAVGVGEDMARSGGSGALRGLAGFVGMGGDLSKGVAALTEKLKNAGMPVEAARGEMLDAMPGPLRRFHETPTKTIGTGEVRGAIEAAMGAPVTSYKPETRAGKYAGTIGEFAGNPASYIAPGTLPAKIAAVMAGGAGSEAAGQATEGSKAEPYARVAGAMGGAFAPGLVARAVTPAPATPARQRLVDILNDEGVTSLTAGQRTGNESLRYAESTLGNAPFTGQPANRIVREGQEQFTEAALRRAGTGGGATPDVLADNQRRLADQFRDLSARNTMQMDHQLGQDLGRAVIHYERVPPSQQKAIVEGYITDIINHARAGNTMPGPVYQEMRSRLSRQSNSLRQSDPTLSEALRDIRNALDDAMGRSINPADRAGWETARREYGAQKVIEKAASRAGEATAEGVIVPANLRNTVAAENRGAYARGEGPFSELARAGAGVMGPMPNSGTAQRSALYHIGDWGSGGAIPALTGRALMSGPVQGYLSNQIASPILQHVARRPTSAAIAALMAAQPQQGGP